MATQRTVTVKASAGDYTTRSAMEAGEQGDMVSLDRVLKYELYDGLADTTQLTFAGWTTDATRYVWGFGMTAYGPKWTSGGPKLTVSHSYNVSAINIGQAINLVLENEQSESTSNLDIVPSALYLPVAAGASVIEIKGGFFRQTSTNVGGGYDSSFAIEVGDPTAHTLNMRNVTMVAADGHAFRNIDGNAAIVNLHYNCTLVNRSATNRVVYNPNRNGGTGRCKNLLIQGTTGAADNFENGGGGTVENVTILTQDATSPTVGLRSLTSTFVDATNWDYHLAAGDTVSKDVGTNLSGDSFWPFSDDGDGVTRAGTWDVGADEFTATALAETVADTATLTDALGFLMGYPGSVLTIPVA